MLSWVTREPCARAARPGHVLIKHERHANAGSERLPQITGVHVGGIRERQLSTGTDDDCLILAGEIDISNDELLTCALRAATGTASGTFRLDLSRVTFLSPPAAGRWWKAPGSSGAGAGTYCS